MLHLWRRLDWRFLLPSLELHRVGYGMGIEGEDVAALGLLDVNANPIGQSAAETLDAVLLSSPELPELRTAVQAVRPGGWVCAAVTRSLVARKRPRTLWGYRRALRRGGLVDVAVYWYAPTLAASARIVPVGSRTAVRNTLARHEGMRFGRMIALIGNVALGLGLFSVAIPEGMVVGQRPDRRDRP